LPIKDLGDVAANWHGYCISKFADSGGLVSMMVCQIRGIASSSTGNFRWISRASLDALFLKLRARLSFSNSMQTSSEDLRTEGGRRMFVTQRTLHESLTQPYLGVWQRRLLQTPSVRDSSTQVYWLQTSLWHADLRIPAKRPNFQRTTSLANCSAAQLTWLATQQGFAGITHVSDTRCTWQRLADFQPDNGTRDVGNMTFCGARLVETGAEADYLEIWERLPQSRGEIVALALDSERGFPPPSRTWLLLVGDYFIFVRNRRNPLPSAPDLPSLIAEVRPSREQLLAWLDFEISFGRRNSNNSMLIELSTLPFREGKVVGCLDAIRRLDDSTAVEEGYERRWKILDWSEN
jgi:hypothetical protein